MTIYKLGDHRLICGDATNSADVAKLMDGKKADLVFTDPPYGMKKAAKGVYNDDLNNDDLMDFNKKWVPVSFDNLKDNGSWYCWGVDDILARIYAELLLPMIRNDLLTFKNLLTWDKGSGHGMHCHNRRMYATADEKCLFVQVGVHGFKNNKEKFFAGFDSLRIYIKEETKKLGMTKEELAKSFFFKSTSMVDHWTEKYQWTMIPEKHWTRLQELAKERGVDASARTFADMRAEYDAAQATARPYFDNVHANFNNVLKFKRHRKDGTEGGHATVKPLLLCEHMITTSSRPGEIVLDLFGGSGSTLIACENLGRRCYMLEYQQKYVDVIISRWEKHTGKKAEVIHEEPPLA